MPRKVTFYKPTIDTLSQANNPQTEPLVENTSVSGQDKSTPVSPLKVIFGKRKTQEQSAPEPQVGESAAEQPGNEAAEALPEQAEAKPGETALAGDAAAAKQASAADAAPAK